jgi:lipid II:glycine glycyltransferase (peptidoglycan interpeptide bridge formation enzyme)
MNVRAVHDRDEWNSLLVSLSTSHVLQSWEWGQFKHRWGWTPRYLLFEDRGQSRAAALILKRTLPRLGLSVMYVPKGPALDYGDASLVEEVLGALQDIARRERAIFIKIDPDVAPPFIPPASRGGKRGGDWRFSSEQIQFRNTVLLNLTPTEEELLAAMKPKTRYNIRLAGKKGVGVRAGGIEDIETLYAMYAETARRDGFIIRPFAYYHDLWSSFIAGGLAQPFIAEVASEPVAGLVLFRFGDRAWYFYGMSRDTHREKMPSHRLQWEAIRWAKSHSCTVYDFWGAPDELNESDPMWGVYRFKEGFGGKFTEHIGAWDYPASKLWYWVYTVAMPRVLDVMRRRHARHAGL